jgi:hypothetical protein
MDWSDVAQLRELARLSFEDGTWQPESGELFLMSADDAGVSLEVAKQILEEESRRAQG